MLHLVQYDDVGSTSNSVALWVYFYYNDYKRFVTNKVFPLSTECRDV